MTKLNGYQVCPEFELRIIDPCNDAGYSKWIASSHGCTIFHSPNWANLLSKSYGYVPKYFALYKGEEIKACVPVMEVNSVFTGRRGVSLSFSDYCPAIIADEGEYPLLLEMVLSYGRSHRWRYAEFRGEGLLREEPPSHAFVQHTLQLQEESVLYSNLRNSCARNIQKAIKEHVIIQIRRDLDGVHSFYQLHCLTRKRQGLPPQPKKYFVNLHRFLLAEGLGFTALAMYEGKAIGGLICLHYGSNAIYKYGASDEKYQSLRPNNLLFWEMIKKCTFDGFKSLSFGRTDINNKGLLCFKDGWGGERNILSYHRYDFRKNAFAAQLKGGRGYESYLNKFPVEVLKALGSIGYRHLG